METRELSTAEKIGELKARRGALILAHNYARPEVQDAADFVGDSLQLSIKARDAGASLMVFCGVSFMAETAKVLSPDSKVLLPVKSAGCPMADMVDAEALSRWRTEHPGAVIVAYVNSSAAVKALSDICCTSANAERVVSSIPEDREVLFLPDRNLGANVAAALGRKMTLWPGFCPVHDDVRRCAVEAASGMHPGCEILIHPECRPDVVAAADGALSTGGMISRAAASKSDGFVIVTEHGILHKLRSGNPGKKFFTVEPPLECPDMKKIRLEDVLRALELDEYEVVLPAGTAEKARVPIERMLELG